MDQKIACLCSDMSNKMKSNVQVILYNKKISFYLQITQYTEKFSEIMNRVLLFSVNNQTIMKCKKMYKRRFIDYCWFIFKTKKN